MSTNKRIFIPDHEYQERIQNAAKLIEKEHLDVLIVNSNEADYGNARYFSGFWPLFERAGVAISASGYIALVIEDLPTPEGPAITVVLPSSISLI